MELLRRVLFGLFVVVAIVAPFFFFFAFFLLKCVPFNMFCLSNACCFLKCRASFFFNVPASTGTDTLSLPAALPIPRAQVEELWTRFGALNEIW